MVVSYHRQLNLDNLFSYKKIDKRDGPSVSALVDEWGAIFSNTGNKQLRWFNPISLGNNIIQYDNPGHRSNNSKIDDDTLLVCQDKNTRAKQMQLVTIPEFYKSNPGTFFHVGNGSGGIVHTHVQGNYITLERISHPWARSLDTERLQSGPATILVIKYTWDLY